MNNMREVALGTLAYHSSKRKLPGPTANGYPDSPGYSTDSGLQVVLLPFLEEQARGASFNNSTTTFALSNNTGFESTPPYLLCPSGNGAESLNDIASYFNGPEIEGLNTQTCDYAGNKGFYDTKPFSQSRGAIPVYVSNAESKEMIKTFGLRSIKDGASSTVLFWESIGSNWYFYREGKLFYEPWERQMVVAPVSWMPFYDAGPSFEPKSIGTKAYMNSWAGFGTGVVWAYLRSDARYKGAFFGGDSCVGPVPVDTGFRLRS